MLFNLIQNRKYYFLLSLAFLIPGIVMMIYNVITLPEHTPWKLSVDFQAGSRFAFKFNGPASEDKIRAVFNEFGVVNPEVTRLGSEADNTWQVRTGELDQGQIAAISDAISTKVAPLDANRTEAASVGPRVAAEVARAALYATLASSAAVLLFIWWAFRAAPHAIRYSICAIIAMLHDVLIAAGLTAIFSRLFNWEVDALFLTAMLTLIGFSVQDTIVVYDRIRENLSRRRGESFNAIVTRSMLETLHRSLAISLCNIFVLIALLLFGGASIKQFVAVLLIGLISGTYSSIFTAVPLVVAWAERSLFGRADAEAVPASA